MVINKKNLAKSFAVWVAVGVFCGWMNVGVVCLVAASAIASALTSIAWPPFE